MENKIIKFCVELFSHVVFIAFLAILNVIIGAKINIPDSLYILSISLLILSCASIYFKWKSTPFDRAFNDESSAYPLIGRMVSELDGYENLRICGASCTSVFSLFDEYVNAMSEGRSLHICMLNPEAKDIIRYLDDCEEDKSRVIEKVRRDIKKLEEKIDASTYQLVENLSFSKDTYGKNLIEASILMWFEAHRLANIKTKGKLSNGLTIYTYNHLPTLKTWIFGDKSIFIGSYGPMPGGAGVFNPINYASSKRGLSLIKDSRRTFNYLLESNTSVIISKDEIKNRIRESNGIKLTL